MRRRAIQFMSDSALRGPWNYRTSRALVFMSNARSRACEPLGSSSKSGTLEAQVGVAPEVDVRAKPTRVKWHERLQRGLLKIWMGSSALWIGCILCPRGSAVA